MSRPFPSNPRGPRRARRPVTDPFVAVPRVSPRWELAALDALMKPKELTKGRIAHAPPLQPWTARDHAHAAAVLRAVSDRLGIDLQPVVAQGDYHLLVRLPPSGGDEARAVAVALSRAFPGRWLVVDRLFVLAGQFHCRERGYKLNLVRATNVHLPRGLRGMLKGLL